MVSSYRNPEAPLCFLLEMTWDFLASSEHDLWHALWRFLAECEEASMSVSTSKFEVIVRCQKNIGLLLFGCQRVAVSRPLGVLFSGDGKRINGWLWWRESWAEAKRFQFTSQSMFKELWVKSVRMRRLRPHRATTGPFGTFTPQSVGEWLLTFKVKVVAYCTGRIHLIGSLPNSSCLSTQMN